MKKKLAALLLGLGLSLVFASTTQDPVRKELATGDAISRQSVQIATCLVIPSTGRAAARA